MNFLSNLLGRLFGKKKDDQAQVAAPQPSSNPIKVQQAAPTQTITLQKVAPDQAQPEQPQQSDSFLAHPWQSIKDAFIGHSNGVGQGYTDGIFGPAIDKLNAGNSVVGENGYFNKQVIQPVTTGLKKVVAPSASSDGSAVGNAKSIGSGLLETLRGGFNASPIGLAANGAISSTSGLIKAARGQQVNPLQEFNNNTQLSEGLNVTNPLGKAAIDLGTNLLAANPKGAIAGVSDLAKVGKAESLLGAGKSIFSGVKNLLGLNPETSGFADQKIGDLGSIKAKMLEVVPGIKSVNPAKVQEVDNVIATLTPKAENPNAGALSNPYGDQTIEDATLAVPALQRAQEAEQLRVASLQKAVPGNRTVNDLTGANVNPQEMDLSSGFYPKDIPTETNIRPIGSDIQGPLAKVQPEIQVAPPVETPPITVAQLAPEVAPIVPESQKIATPVATPQEIPPVQPVTAEGKVAGNSPEVATPAGDGTPKAPRQAEILIDKEAQADKAEFASKLPKKEAASLDDLQAKGAGRTAAITDDTSLAQTYGNQPDLQNPEDYYAALEAAKRLSGKADDVSKNARSNIYNAMVEYAAKAGLNLRSTQVLWDDMPVEMRVSTTIKSAIKTLEKRFGADSPQVAELKDPSRLSEVEARFTALFNKDQSIRDSMVPAKAVIAAATENPAAHTAEAVHASRNAIDAASGDLGKNADKFAKLRDELVPNKVDWQDKIGTLQRNSMLSSASGMFRDLIQTPLTAAREVIPSAIEGTIGKVLNKVTGDPGKFIDSRLGFGDVVSGVPSALKKFGKNVQEGNSYASIDDVMKNIKRTPDRTDISGATNGMFTKLIKAKTNLANDAVEGLNGRQIERLVQQEGQKAGFKGEDLKTYVAAASYNPSPEIARKAQQLQDVVNNVNKNWLTDMLRGGNEAISKVPVIGKTVANALDPFPTWVGGNIFNTIGDRNVIANTVKFISNLKRDPQYAISQFSKALVGAGELYGGGYLLAKNGVLTEKDANGDSYEGLYFHVGDRYIPVSNAGAASANIILGYSAYKALNGDANGDGKGVAQGISDTASKLFKSLNVDSITGANSFLQKSIAEFPKDPGTAIGTAAAGVAGQLIPAVGGDVNSVLDNYTGLNPTKEAADTKVVNPNSASGQATDILKTAGAKLLNKIPVLSQQLPRQEGVSAKDPIDKVTNGNRDTSATVDARDLAKVDAVKAKTVEERSKDFKTRNIPDPKSKVKDYSFDDAVAASVGKGDYDSAIEGLKAQLDDYKAGPTVAPAKVKEKEDDIKRLGVAKDGKFDPSVIDLYKKTTLTEWRDMGDPESDSYDQAKYDQLYAYDTALADAGVSRSTKDGSDNVYSAKVKKAKGTGSKKDTAETQNTVGSIVNLGSVNLSKLSGKSTGVAAVPTVQKLRSSDLVKKRKISVGK